MVKKVETQFFEMGFHLLSGIIVDKELADKLQVVLEEARKKVCQLLDENKEHLKESSDHTVYPFGKSTSINVITPKGAFDLSYDQRKSLLDSALAMKPIEHLYESDSRDFDKLKAIIQRDIEDKQLAEEGGNNG